MPVLCVMEGDCSYGLYTLSSDVVIGRRPECDILLKHVGVSRRHARIMMLDGCFYIEDLGSRNGTLVNGRPITMRVELREVDHIKIAAYTLRLDLTSPVDRRTSSGADSATWAD